MAAMIAVAMLPSMAVAQDFADEGIYSQPLTEEELTQEGTETELQLNRYNPIFENSVYLSVMGVNGDNIWSGFIANIGLVTVYDLLTEVLSGSNTTYDITPEKINSINGIGPGTTGGTKPAWFFAINQDLAKESIGTARVKRGDILRVFYVKNADTAKLGYVEPVGVAGDYFGKSIFEEKNSSYMYANVGDSFWLSLFGKSLNFNDLSVEKQESPQAKFMSPSGENEVDLVLDSEGFDEINGFGLPYKLSTTGLNGGLIKMTKPSSSYEFIPGYIKVLERPETLGDSNFFDLYFNWMSEARYKLIEENFLENETENFFYEAMNSSDYLYKNAWVAMAHRDLYNNDVKLGTLNFKNLKGEYLNMVWQEDPLNGFAPYQTSYSLGNTLDNMILNYSCLGDQLTVVVTVPQGVTYDAATGSIGNLQGKTGEITIEVQNNETNRYNTYTVSFDNAVLAQPKFVAYLPGYGQFTNERPNQGYWGDAYVAGNIGRKNMINNMVQTGVSLGSFGGFAVFDFGDEGISNSPSNKYGVDFIVYGNAFNGNAEPGGVQVSADGNNWYNIAGSRHYRDDTIWNYTVEHKNPTPDDDNITAVYDGNAYTDIYTYFDKKQARPNFPIEAGTGEIRYNSWHEHSWYPLYGNYFVPRNSGETPLANLELTNSFATYTPKSVENPSELKLKGTKINFTSMSAADYTFGYCDVHSNGNTPGMVTNPYAATASTMGGDGIDISWAVDANGNPVNLEQIRYVRIYTGVMKDNPPFGETSTEVCGIYKVSETGSGAAVADLEIEDGLGNSVAISNMGIRIVNAGRYNLNSASEFVYINGERITEADSGYEFELQPGQIVQIIAQNGTESPYVTVIRCN